MKRLPIRVLALGALLTWVAMVHANGVNPPRTVVGVDAECRRADGTVVSVQNARVLGLLPERQKVGFLQVRYGDADASGKVSLDSIERLTIPAGEKADDRGFVHGQVKAHGADESLRVQVKSSEGAVMLVGTADVALLDCREITFRERDVQGSDDGRNVPMK